MSTQCTLKNINGIRGKALKVLSLHSNRGGGRSQQWVRGLVGSQGVIGPTWSYPRDPCSKAPLAYMGLSPLLRLAKYIFKDHLE